jgi:hypothetical protein
MDEMSVEQKSRERIAEKEGRDCGEVWSESGKKTKKNT